VRPNGGAVHHWSDSTDGLDRGRGTRGGERNLGEGWRDSRS